MSERVHGMTLRALPIRGPDAVQRRQPQRVQPGGFFRPLVGRSKRGPPDGSDRQDGCLKADVRSCTFIELHRRKRTIPAQLSPAECWKTRPCPDWPSAVANAIGHIDDRASVSAKQAPPRKARGKESGEKGRESRQAAQLFLLYIERRADRKKVSTRDWDGSPVARSLRRFLNHL
jgi:hypothetical protein